jgi:hypothetical protein
LVDDDHFEWTVFKTEIYSEEQREISQAGEMTLTGHVTWKGLGEEAATEKSHIVS